MGHDLCGRGGHVCTQPEEHIVFSHARIIAPYHWYIVNTGHVLASESKEGQYCKNFRTPFHVNPDAYAVRGRTLVDIV